VAQSKASRLRFWQESPGTKNRKNPLECRVARFKALAPDRSVASGEHGLSVSVWKSLKKSVAQIQFGV